MYLEPDMLAGRLGRVTQRAQENVAEGLARRTQSATAKLSGTVAPAPRQLQMMAPPPREGERRSSGRFATGTQIHARRIPGVNFEIPLDNVSPGGCRLEMIEECQVGEDVIARFPELEPMGARVLDAGNDRGPRVRAANPSGSLRIAARPPFACKAAVRLN